MTDSVHDSDESAEPNHAIIGPPLLTGIGNRKRQEKADETFSKLEIDGNGFLTWLLVHFSSGDRSVGCGECCRGLVPSLVRYCEMEYRQDFASMVSCALAFMESGEGRGFLLANLEHYYSHPTGSAVHERRLREWQRLKGLFQEPFPDMQNENNDLDREIADLLASMKSAEKSFNCRSWDPSIVMPKKATKKTAPTDVPETVEPKYPGDVNDVLVEFSEWLPIKCGQPLSEIIGDYTDISLPLGGGAGTYDDPAVISGDFGFDGAEKVAKSTAMAFFQAFNLGFEDEPFNFRILGTANFNEGAEHLPSVMVGLSEGPEEHGLPCYIEIFFRFEG